MSDAKFGMCEGDVCQRGGCRGVIEARPVENCSCHINPPCSACTEPRNYCEKCGWEESEEELPALPPQYTGVTPASFGPKPLDSSKIDWRPRPHTHFSMIKEGVYPDGTTKAEVEEKVKGTFGGRFLRFGNGNFEYVAYTD